ncbi:pentatricopeptide repeat-containing protein 2, mitochondrial isoform X2 [Emydura macquarii macquarii]
MEKKELILRNELKILLHLCQTSDDVEIAKSAIYRYHSENRTMAFGDYKFGPIFMRLCYELGLEVPAVELIKDETLYGFFSDGQSFALLMDMLFKKGYYEDAFEVLEEMEKQHVKYIKDTFLLAFAICYKLNSPVSWKKFTKILEENQFQLDTLPRITYCFAVAFALKQNDLEKAQYIYSLIMNPDSRLCTNLKILMQIKSGALEETLKTLEAVLEENTPELVKKTQISEQVLATVREELEENPALLVRLEDIYDQLKASGKVTKLTLDEMLCKIPLYKEYYKKLSTERTVSLRTFKPLQSVLKTE